MRVLQTSIGFDMAEHVVPARIAEAKFTELAMEEVMLFVPSAEEALRDAKDESLLFNTS